MFSKLLFRLVIFFLVMLFTSASDNLDEKSNTEQSENIENGLDDVKNENHFVCGTGSVVKPEQVEDWLSFIKSNEVNLDNQNEEIVFDDAETNYMGCNLDCPQCCTFGWFQNPVKAFKQQLEENKVIVQLLYPDKSKILAPFVNGELEGLVLGFDQWFGQHNLTMIANFKQGKLVAPVWKLLEENGFLVLDNLDFTGEGIYIYPGFKIGLTGIFKKSEMIETRPATIKGYSCTNNGAILEPIHDQVGADLYTRDVSNLENLSSHPLLKDPLEDVFVEVQKSSIASAGEGLFLKQDVQAGTIVAFFNGVRVELEDTLTNPNLEMTPYKIWNDWEDKEQLIFIPKDFQSVSAYNATHGHKINHSPEPNVDYGFIDHPRFGKIRSVVTTKALKSGDELYCEYAPTVDGSTFLRLVFKDFLQYMDIDEQSPQKSEFLKKMKNNYQNVVTNLMSFDLESKYEVPPKP